MTKLTTRALMVAGAVLLAAAFAVPAFAAYPPEGASVSTQDSSGRPDSTFQRNERFIVRGSDFDGDTNVTIEFEQSPGVELAETRTNSSGNFAVRVTVPGSAQNGSATIRATGGGESATAGITIVSAGGVVNLPATGQPIASYALWGFTLVAFGGFLLVMTYRRWQMHRLAAAVITGRVWVPTDDVKPTGPSERVATRQSHMSRSAVEELKRDVRRWTSD